MKKRESDIEKDVLAAKSLNISYGKYIAQRDGFTTPKNLPPTKRRRVCRGTVYRRLQGMPPTKRAEILGISEEDASLIMIFDALQFCKVGNFCPRKYTECTDMYRPNFKRCIDCKRRFLNNTEIEL